jgi:outer membrane protein insertion porin family
MPSTNTRAERAGCRGRRSTGRLLLLLACLGFAVPAAAQPPLDRLVGKRIAQIRLAVQGRDYPDVEVKRVLETTEGAAFSTSDVRESLVHLMALGRFEDVRVSAEDTPAGLRITYDLVPLRSVNGIVFRGELGLSARQLRNEVTNRYGPSPAAARGEEMARALESYYHERGFLRAAVTPRVEVKPGAEHSTLVFDIVPGARATVGTVEIKATPEAAAIGVVARLGLARGEPFDPTALRERAASYADELRSRGFIETQVEVQPSPSSDDGSVVDVAVRIARGPHVTIALRGDPLPATRKDELAVLRGGGTVDEDMLENEQWRLEDDLRAEGYRDAEVRQVREQRGPDEVAVVFTIKRGPQYRVGRVDITGTRHLPLTAIKPSLRLVAGQWFVKSRLDGDVATLAERYRRDGFREAKIQAQVAAAGGAQPSLDVVLAVSEGPQTRIDAIEFGGNASLSRETLAQAAQVKPGAPYYDPDLSTARDAVLGEYLSRGYQLANVDLQTAFSADRTRATLKFAITEGPQIRVDHVLVVGNVRTKVDMIERESGLRRGMALSYLRLADAQNRLTALGLFRRVQVSELQHGSETDRDVLVTVEEGQPNTIGYGGGLEVASRGQTDVQTGVRNAQLDFAPRGFVEYGRRNLWGKNRSVNVFARAAIRTSAQSDAFREYRLLGTYREPRAFGTALDFAFTAVTEQAIRSSFDLNRRQITLEGTHRFNRTVTLGGRYQIGRTRLFNEQYSEEDKLLIDRVYSPGVKISSFAASVTRDTRDDPAEPTRGALLLLDGTMAARRIGSDVGFVRGFAQAFAYRSLPILRGSVLAVGARLGLVSGFARMIENLDENGRPIIGPDGSVELKRTHDVVISERFFAGGDNTVRGFEQDQLGVPEVLAANGASKGGNALVIFNGELRFPVLQKVGLGGATFVDVGNVFNRVNDLDLGRMRTGFGFGIRWRSPVGPLRIDLGWKASQHRFANGSLEPRLSPYVSIGQAF